MDHASPRDLVRQLETEFGPWDLDCAADYLNTVCPRYYQATSPRVRGHWSFVDGLARPWRGRCWLNPPYGRGLGAWVAKARREASRPGTVVVCLLPARTDVRGWHDHVMVPAVDGGPSAVRFLRGRLRFGGAKGHAPFPSVVVVFGGGA